MFQNMLRNKMTPLGWTLDLELGTGQLGRCWCWAPKVLVTGYWADVELLKRSFSRRNWSPSVSCGRFSAPTVTLTDQTNIILTFIDIFLYSLTLFTVVTLLWAPHILGGLKFYLASMCFTAAFQSHHHLQSFIPHCLFSWILYLCLECKGSECSRSPLPLVLWIDQESFTNHFLSWLSNS